MTVKRTSLRPLERKTPLRVEVHPHGLSLTDTGKILPLFAGSMHYWRHEPDDWGPCLDAMKAMGLRLVDIYVPWGVHEIAQGSFDFGTHFGRLDVARFVRMCGERGLYVILRPGPHINAELTYFGLPERVVWDKECQARTPKDNPVILPMIPSAFPVPSYASDAFHDETALWFEAVGRELSGLLYPAGPIVMCQIDNEGALYFRDGPYDQDYHPDAIRLFRDYLREKYPTISALRDAWSDDAVTFAGVVPPERFDAAVAKDLPRHMDWMEFHEHLLSTAMARIAESLSKAGLDGVPTMHNLPLGEAATPLNPGRITEVVDLVGLDYYHAATPAHHATILRRTGELASRCEGMDAPAYGAEVGAGFPPFFPPLDEKDSLYTLLAATAYGLRGFNLYMAVDRDRWVGAPIDARGMPRKLADDYKALIAAFERVSMHTLTRRAPVRLVVPRSLRRLSRATHAFGPVTPVVFNVAGAGPLESCFEEDFGLGEPAPIVGYAFIRAFERALLARGVPFAYAGGESLDASTKGATWIVCTTAGGLKRDVVTSLCEARARGVAVTIGPTPPIRDGSMRPLDVPHDVSSLELEPLEDPAHVAVLVGRYVDELGLPTYPVDPPDVHVSVLDDAKGAPKVVFVMNPTAASVVATVGLGKIKALTDLLPRGQRAPRLEARAGGFVIEVPARTVRVFAVDPAQNA